MNWEKITKWGYRVFMYFVPCGVALYTFLISKLMDENVSITAKIGVSGIFTAILIAVIAIYFFGKHLRKKKDKLVNEILECMDNDKKAKLIAKKRKVEAIQEIFHNCIFITPFILCYVLILLVEKECISIRGTLFYVCVSMASGLGLNGVSEWLKVKNAKK